MGQHEKLNELARRNIPFVVWGGQMPRQLYCTVGGDNFNGGYLATQHLLILGRRRIVFIGDKEATETQQRYAGFCARMKNTKLLMTQHFIFHRHLQWLKLESISMSF